MLCATADALQRRPGHSSIVTRTPQLIDNLVKNSESVFTKHAAIAAIREVCYNDTTTVSFASETQRHVRVPGGTGL